MKNIYNISKGQLITLWVFGFAMEIWALAEATDWFSPSAFAGFLAILFPFILVFYTLGWRNHRKNKGD